MKIVFIPRVTNQQQAPYTELGGSSPLSEEHMLEIGFEALRGEELGREELRALRDVIFQLLSAAV